MGRVSGRGGNHVASDWTGRLGGAAEPVLLRRFLPGRRMQQVSHGLAEDVSWIRMRLPSIRLAEELVNLTH